MILILEKISSKILKMFQKMISSLEIFLNILKTISIMKLMKVCAMIFILEELLKMLKIGHIKILDA
jgi:hypothetical protein